jgi:predicted PhzF superfamily epimerase YddE/YHI9
MKCWQVDSFTQVAFKGNPAAVVLLDAPLDDKVMQDIAAEMNLSETAFLLRQPGNPLLRWMTPKVEVDLCGHATLAAAHIWLSAIEPKASHVTFATKYVGDLTVAREGERYVMDFPSRPGDPVAEKDIPPTLLAGVQNKTPREILVARDYMLVYDDAAIVRQLKPDFSLLNKTGRWVIVTAPSDDKNYDVVSRFFCASDGIEEDPVTGSAHCTIVPYWAKKLGKTTLSCYQASERGGDLLCTLEENRVLIRGYTKSILEGTLHLS